MNAASMVCKLRNIIHLTSASETSGVASSTQSRTNASSSRCGLSGSRGRVPSVKLSLAFFSFETRLSLGAGHQRRPGRGAMGAGDHGELLGLRPDQGVLGRPAAAQPTEGPLGIP